MYPEVLIIDDEVMNIEILKAMLWQRGFKCDCAFSGLEALQLLKRRIQQVERRETSNYRLILTDYSMPEMDGPMLVKMIRREIDVSQMPAS